MPIEAIIFDLGRVLIDVDFTDLFKKHIPENSRSGFSFSLEDVMHHPWFREFSMGKCSAETFYKRIAEFFKLDLSFTKFKNEWVDIFSPIPGMEEIVRKSAEKLAVGLLSDTDILHWQFLLKEYPFLKIFTNPVLSFRIGTMKPDPVCYKTAAQSVNKAVNQCLFIDDRPVNVQGAKKTGMHAVEFKSPEKLLEEFKNYNIYL